jgi:hypothetical protein
VVVEVAAAVVHHDLVHLPGLLRHRLRIRQTSRRLPSRQPQPGLETLESREREALPRPVSSARSLAVSPQAARLGSPRAARRGSPQARPGSPLGWTPLARRAA